MCGIAGYYGLTEPSLLDVMNEAQQHRGPDGSGVFTKGPVGFAHRRLAIIDRAGGQQPMTLADGTLTIVFNGEIYNYINLRDELKAKGREFITDSDTEVILHGYREWGDALWDKLNGMFAIGLYDDIDQSLRLVRDHFGIKPLYYSRPTTKSLLFASEIKALLATGKIERTVNDTAIYRYLMFRIQDDGPETFFGDVARVEAGELLVIKDGRLAHKRYTSLEQKLANANATEPYDSNAMAEIAASFERSVTLRLQSEVPVGTSLSGGLDSSAVAAVIAEKLAEHNELTAAVGPRQNTFSAVFPNMSNDEERYVDAFLDMYGDKIQPHKIKPTPGQFVEDLADFIRTQEEPVVSSGPYAQYQLMREATNHVTVLLDGQGADEMMAGYVPYYLVYLRQLRRQKRWLKLMVEATLSIDVLLRLARSRIRQRLSFRTRVSTSQLLASEFRKQHVSEKFSVTSDNLKQRLVEDVFHHSIPSLLRYEDRNTMRFSLEGRVPFLDKDYFQKLFSYSDDAIIKNGVNKRALRDSMHGRLPEMIRARRNKIGFTTPEYEWAMSLKKEFYSVFNSQSFTKRPYFDGPAVLQAFEGFVHRRNDASTMLFWRLMNVELWLREFIDTPEERDKFDAITSKAPFAPNGSRKLDIKTDYGVYRRFPIQTSRVDAGTDIVEFVSTHVHEFVADLARYPKRKEIKDRTWYIFVSEKIVAITQGRSYFIWDINAGFWARLLSRFVKRTPAGIGLGSPWTMEIAIREAGIWRILYATVGSLLGKLVGKKGVFYNLVGGNVRAIDGPTQYSVYPANVSAKLPPKDPEVVAGKLSDAIREKLPPAYSDTFGGVVVIDSNDIGRNSLGSSTNLDASHEEAIFGDNPLGQAKEQTPLAFVVLLDSK